jgi:hypothetical protein
MPYGPDLRRLNEAIPLAELSEGKTFTHEQLEGIVNEKRGTGRYYAVLNSWMKQQKKSNGVLMRWQPSVGIVVQDPADKLKSVESRMHQKLKQTGRAAGEIIFVDRSRLDETGQRRLDHETRRAHAIKDWADGERKQLAIELAPVKSLPKPKLVKEA